MKTIQKKVLLASVGVFALGVAGTTVNAKKDQDKPPSGSSQNISGTVEAQKKAKTETDISANIIVGGEEFRNFDGSGNNQADNDMGSTFIHLLRIGKDDYADKISALAGPNRPSARVVSNNVVDQAGASTPNTFSKTDFVWQWGQFLDHDIDLTDGNPAFGTADILVPAGDPDFDPDSDGDVVIPFARAVFDPDTGDSKSNPREQENEITAWIDASNVYGSDASRANALRTFSDGKLKTSAGNLLPFNVDGLPNANGPAPDPTALFLAGDVRANEQVGLAVMHTLFVREHNRLADIVAATFGLTDDEEIYQTTRKLVGAEMQMITYNEFLPALLGPNALPPYVGYDPNANGDIRNEFSVAAYRFGHSAINAFLQRLDATGADTDGGPLPLRSAFFSAPSILTDADSLDSILRGLATQPHQRIDEKIVDDLRNFLFGPPGAGGLDLASLNIQRGRDHGVGSLYHTRKELKLKKIKSFADISSDLAVQQALADTYDSVEDVDLWVGGLAEDTVGASQLGETFTTILALQFTALRDADRFWYQHNLTSAQLALVDGRTLADVIRDNTGVDVELQDDVFSVPTP